MVDLVAEAAGGKTGAFDLKRVAVPILCADFDMVRTLDDAVPLRQAQELRCQRCRRSGRWYRDSYNVAVHGGASGEWRYMDQP